MGTTLRKDQKEKNKERQHESPLKFLQGETRVVTRGRSDLEMLPPSNRSLGLRLSSFLPFLAPL